LVQRKPGALRNGALFADMPAPFKQLKLGLLRHNGGDKVMAQVLAAVPTAGLEAVLIALELVIESGTLSAEHVLNVVARLISSAPLHLTISNTLFSLDVALEGVGLAYTFEQLAELHIREKRLRRVLTEFSPTFPGSICITPADMISRRSSRP